MANVKGRGVTVEVSSTYGTAKVVSAVTKANPGVASSTSHAMANNTVGYFDDVVGMGQLQYQACRVKNTATNAFDLQGLNTTNFSDFTSGDFIPVTAWATLSESTSYSIGGGAGDKLDATRLIDLFKQEEQGNLPVQTVSMSVLAQDTPSAAMLLLESAAQTATGVVVRITLPNGAVRIAYAEPSLPGEDVQQGQLGTGSLDFAVKGFVLKLAA
jgi:hypothetical protein